MQDEPKTIRVTCPECTEKTAFATIPQSSHVVSTPPGDGTVQSLCRQCDSAFTIYFANN